MMLRCGTLSASSSHIKSHSTTVGHHVLSQFLPPSLSGAVDRIPVCGMCSDFKGLVAA